MNRTSRLSDAEAAAASLAVRVFGLRASEVARRLGTTPNAVTNVSRGERHPIATRWTDAIAQRCQARLCGGELPPELSFVAVAGPSLQEVTGA